MRKPISLAAAAAVALLSGLTPATAQTVEELVAKNIKARGGEEKLKAVNTVRMAAKVNVQGMELPMTINVKRPNLTRQDIQIQDKKAVTAFDGTKGWTINPMRGSDTPQEITGPQADLQREQADIDGPFIDYKAKGTTIEFVKGEGPGGTEKLADGTLVHKLKVTRKGGRPQMYFLDAESGVELRTSLQMEQGGQTLNLEQELADYRPVDGIMMPHTLKQFINGNPAVTMTIDKIELNVPIDDALFRMPEKKPVQ